jgi:glutathione S-transferase
MSAKLYSLKLSHPAHTARLMLEHKRIEHSVVNLVPGLHPQVLRGLGFPRGTVPALKIDGRRIQGSLEISAALEQLQPEPALYPRDRDGRRAVQEAERWGEEELQELARRIFRWVAAEQPEVRRWIAVDIVGVPAPDFMDRPNASLARRFARASDATDEHVRRDLVALPALLDHVDDLIDRETIAGPTPNAADFQIAPSLRMLLAVPALRPVIEPRPCGKLAERLLPDYPDPFPAEIPAAWVAASARPAATAQSSTK